MAIYEEKIRVTVVVIIEELQSPTAQHLRCGSNLSGLVRENQILLVVIETEKLSIDVGHKKILPAIPIIVRCDRPICGEAEMSQGGLLVCEIQRPPITVAVNSQLVMTVAGIGYGP